MVIERHPEACEGRLLLVLLVYPPAAGVRMAGQGEQIPTIIIVFPLSSAPCPAQP